MLIGTLYLPELRTLLDLTYPRKNNLELTWHWDQMTWFTCLPQSEQILLSGYKSGGVLVSTNQKQEKVIATSHWYCGKSCLEQIVFTMRNCRLIISINSINSCCHFMSFVHGCCYISIVNPIVKIAIIYNGIQFAINSFQRKKLMSLFDLFCGLFKRWLRCIPNKIRHTCITIQYTMMPLT